MKAQPTIILGRNKFTHVFYMVNSETTTYEDLWY